MGSLQEEFFLLNFCNILILNTILSSKERKLLDRLLELPIYFFIEPNNMLLAQKGSGNILNLDLKSLKFRKCYENLLNSFSN